MNFLSACDVFLSQGFVYSLIALGYYVSFHILDFPDLTVEGTFLSGAVAYGLICAKGINPFIGILLAFIVGALFGALTGILNVKLKIRPLLCGILVSTMLISINLVATSVGLIGDFTVSGETSIPYGRDVITLHSSSIFSFIPAKVRELGNIGLRDLVIFFMFALICKILLDLYLKTKNGLLLRATGNNPQFVKMLSCDPGKSKIIGLAIGNGLAAISGALYTEINGNVNQSMGIGMIVIGLASLIIGISLFQKVKFMKDTTKVILGAIIYQACLTVAQKLGVPSAYNKMIMAVLFTIALLLSGKLQVKGGSKNART
ncbi:MAG: ABC transporter permease [Clostridia bacterium]|nr:ABC transporter permease [Clostridia bacterium]